jgi:hypothetical protein
VGIRRQREGAGDGGGGGARGGRHARRDARVLGGCWLGGVQGNWNPKREEGAGKGREEGVSVRKTRGASETKQNSLVGSRRGSRKAWWTLGERGAIDCEGMGWSTCERDLLATEYAARGQRERERGVWLWCGIQRRWIDAQSVRSLNLHVSVHVVTVVERFF